MDMMKKEQLFSDSDDDECEQYQELFKNSNEALYKTA